MKIIRKIFHFLGGIQLAIGLISITALLVIIGTFLESYTDSHLKAAHWTYEHPFFNLLLALFFVNILFSALRRWPFKAKHIPFLITHIGLLMIIGGTILKNRFGLQGNLSIWEGSANQNVILPHTYALLIEKNENSSKSNPIDFIPLRHLNRNLYFSAKFPELKCKILGSTPHSTNNFESWFKNNKIDIKGFPPLDMTSWSIEKPLPKSLLTHLSFNQKQKWEIFAIECQELNVCANALYQKNLFLVLTDKTEPHTVLKIPLETSIQEPFTFRDYECKVNCDLDFSSKEGFQSPKISLKLTKNEVSHDLQVMLNGNNALYVQNHPKESESFVDIDLIRTHPMLCFVKSSKNEQRIFAFDSYGRVYQEDCNTKDLQTMFSYEQGFGGYATQLVLPFPEFPASRQDKEHAQQWRLTQQIRETLSMRPELTPPLLCLSNACEKAKVDLASVFVTFLSIWRQSASLLFPLSHEPDDELKKALNALDWKTLSSTDDKAIRWTVHLLDQLTPHYHQGKNFQIILQEQQWPLMKNLKNIIKENPNVSSVTLLSQQIFSLVHLLPDSAFPDPTTVTDRARFLSAYFRGYGIDSDMLINPTQDSQKENFDELMSYWKDKRFDSLTSESKETILETNLFNLVTPTEPPSKVEDFQPGIVVEVQDGFLTQKIALTYDPTGSGLKWPILNGAYCLRFQPQFYKIPYRIRLREARQITYPESNQTYSYESDVLISDNDKTPEAFTLSMNQVHETYDGYRFYLSGIGSSTDRTLKRVQIVVNHDPAKYWLTYPGALLVFFGIILLFWMKPYSKK